MTKLHHIQCGTLQPAEGVTILCHCLLLEDKEGLALVDTGIGLKDIQDPVSRIGKQLMDRSGFRFNAPDTAFEQIKKMGLQPSAVTHCIISHLDPDHIGGLSDFPQAQVHVSREEYDSFWEGNFRYRTIQLDYKPVIHSYDFSSEKWFGLEARKVKIPFASTVYLIPLFGHTAGHCGVAIEQHGKWILYAGDAYYLRVELQTDNHPVTEVSRTNAINEQQRVISLKELRRLYEEHDKEIVIFGYHDPEEYMMF